MEIFGVRISKYEADEETLTPVYEIQKGARLTQSEMDEARFYMHTAGNHRFHIQIYVLEDGVGLIWRRIFCL